MPIAFLFLVVEGIAQFLAISALVLADLFFAIESLRTTTE